MSVDTQLHSIIDELDPSYRPVSDEEMIEDNDDHGVFERSFAHTDGKIYKLSWSVYYGTPETVRTVFNPIEQVGFAS